MQRKPPVKRSAIIYLRVSTTRQAKESDSPNAQLSACAEFARRRGLRVLCHFSDDGRSGRTTRGRKGLEDAMKKARGVHGVLVVRSLSRLGRSVIDLHTIARTLERSGADLASVNEAIDTSTAAGRAFFGFLAVMAQFETDLISERTKEAIAFRKAIGKPILCGVQPLGTRVLRGKLVEEPRGVKIISLMFSLRKRGKSYKQIAADLNRRRLPTGDQLNGRNRPGIKQARWHGGVVHRTMKRAECNQSRSANKSQRAKKGKRHD